ncbi:hypothetical protein KBD49_11080 [Myxococcota bacterium]|nr:hypothetical protein [Myxococcota bacterium]
MVSRGSPHRPSATAFLALLPWLVAVPGCGGSGVGEEPLPEVVTRCGACHDLDALGRPAEGSSAAAGDWLANRGEGLVRVDPLFPEPGSWWDTPWPKRGVHDAKALADCSGCHPVSGDGIGHGIRTFRSPGTVFAPGLDCAGACHGWLPAQAEASGFRPAAGEAPRYRGSLRPGDLLAGADNAHARLFGEGARPSRPDESGYGSFRPGCGGCHQVATEDHGHVPTCLACHRFGGPGGRLHRLHQAAIEANVAAVDPALVEEGGDPCAYCHAPEAGTTARSRRACHNCHLSGHQPLDAQGRAHFWR